MGALMKGLIHESMNRQRITCPVFFTMSDDESSSDCDWFSKVSADVLDDDEETSAKRQVAIDYESSKPEWRRNRSALWDNGMVKTNEVEIRDRTVKFVESTGQQQHAWDCSFVLSKFFESSTVFPEDFFMGKHVIELGCGVGLPGLSAAALGASRVILSDMPHAVSDIERSIALNQFSGEVEAVGLMWGADTARDFLSTRAEAGRKFDVILCSDLIYGDTTTSKLLADTICELAAPDCLIVFVHEARWAGDRGQSFFETITARGRFVMRRVGGDEMHSVYQDTVNIHVTLMGEALPLPLAACASPSDCVGAEQEAQQ